jgi:hypothetical protein
METRIVHRAHEEPSRATRIARGWFDIPYPLFKRLALFAAGRDDDITDSEWVAWLVADDGWLWDEQSKREAMRLLVKRGTSLEPGARERLETAILRGPPAVTCLSPSESLLPWHAPVILPRHNRTRTIRNLAWAPMSGRRAADVA